MRGQPAREDIPADITELIRIGTVVEVDLGSASCRVRYGDPDDEGGGATTGPIRWLMPRSGETRVWSPPSVGEQVLLLAPDGQIGAAIALGGIVQDAFPPPATDEATLLQFTDGAQLRYDPVAHRLEATLPDGGETAIVSPGGLSIDAAGGITFTGDVAISGNVAVTGKVEASEDVTAGSISLKDHTHGQVQSGAGISGPPQ